MFTAVRDVDADGFDVERIGGREVMKIVGVTYGLISSSVAKDMAVMEVKSSQLYDKKCPKRGGLHDPRIGSIERGQTCGSCGLLHDLDIGHPSYLSCPLPFYLSQHVDDVFKILKCVCFYCSALLIPRDSVRVQQLIASNPSRRTRLKELVQLCSEVKVCGNLIREERFVAKLNELTHASSSTTKENHKCGGRQPKYYNLKIAIQATFTLPLNEPPPRYNPFTVWQILHDISDDDARILGMDPDLSRPEDLMIVDLYVPPSSIRPPVISSEASRHRGEDDLTLKLAVIKKLQDRMKKHMDSSGMTNAMFNLRCMHGIYQWELPAAPPNKKPLIVVCECDEGWVAEPSATCKCVEAARNPPPAAPAKKEAKDEPSATSTVGTITTNRKRKRERKDKNIIDYWHDLQSAIHEYIKGTTPKTKLKAVISTATVGTAGTGKSNQQQMGSLLARTRAERQRYARPAHGMRGLEPRQKSKRGRIRANIQGKRQNDCGRTVISGCLDMDINEIGIPHLFKRTLTVLEEVNPHNIARLTTLLRRGEINYLYVETSASYDAQGRKTASEMEEINTRFINLASTCLRPYVMLVRRQLQNGDPLLFGRQPSLHRPSMMVMRARILPRGYDIIQMNTACTTPYNADYDGDEMNIEVPQGLQARSEALILMDTQWQLLSQAGWSTIIGIVQHSLLGAYLTSLPDVLLTREAILQYAMAFGDVRPPSTAFIRRTLTRYLREPLPLPSIKVNGKALWTGKQLIELFFPSNFVYRHPFDEKLWQHDAVLLSPMARARIALRRGQYEVIPMAFWKDFATTSSRIPWLTSEHHRMAHQAQQQAHQGGGGQGKQKCTYVDQVLVIHHGRFLSGTLTKANYGNGCQTVLHLLVHVYGLLFAAKYLSGIQRVLNRVLEDLGCTFGPREFLNPDPEYGHKMIDLAEAWVRKQTQYDIAKFDSQEERICSILDRTREAIGEHLNKQLDMRSGSVFRNGLNDIITSGTKGQAIHRIQIAGLLGQNQLLGTRFHMPTAHYTELTHDARAHGFVAHSFAEGLTPEETMFHSAGGRQGIVDTAAVTSNVGYNQRCASKALSDLVIMHDGTVRDAYQRIIEMKFGENGFEPSRLLRVPLRWLHIRTVVEFQRLYGSSTHVLNVFLRMWKALALNRSTQPAPVTSHSACVSCPIHFQWLLTRHCTKEQYEPPYSIEQLETLTGTLWRDMTSVWYLGGAKRRQFLETGCTMFHCLFLDWFNPQRLHHEHRVTPSMWQAIVRDVEQALKTAFVEQGDSVGTSASQVISAPGMQMTLNTFHLAGYSNSSQNGFQMLKEIIRASQSMSNRSMIVHLVEPLCYNKRAVQRMAQQIPGRMLKDLVLAGRSTVVSNVDNNTVVGCACLDAARPFVCETPYRLVFILNATKCRPLNVSVHHVVHAIEHHLDAQEKLLHHKTALMTANKKPKKDNTSSTSTTSTAKKTKKKKKTTKAAKPSKPSKPIQAVVRPVVLSCVKEGLVEVYVPTTSLLIQRIVRAFEGRIGTTDTARLLQFAYQTLSLQLNNDVLIRGLLRITKTTVREGKFDYVHEATGQIESRLEYYIVTVGSQLEQIWQWPHINFSRTMSTDVREIESLLGIEAARCFIADQLDSRLKSNQSELAMQWLSLLSAYMTRSGTVVPITANGVAQESKSAIRNASFEKVTRHLQGSALFGSKDGVCGTTEAIAVSSKCPTGAGLVYLKADPAQAPIRLRTFDPRIPLRKEHLQDSESFQRSCAFYSKFWPTTLRCVNSTTQVSAQQQPTSNQVTTTTTRHATQRQQQRFTVRDI